MNIVTKNELSSERYYGHKSNAISCFLDELDAIKQATLIVACVYGDDQKTLNELSFAIKQLPAVVKKSIATYGSISLCGLLDIPDPVKGLYYAGLIRHELKQSSCENFGLGVAAAGDGRSTKSFIDAVRASALSRYHNNRPICVTYVEKQDIFNSAVRSI